MVVLGMPPEPCETCVRLISCPTRTSALQVLFWSVEDSREPESLDLHKPAGFMAPGPRPYPAIICLIHVRSLEASRRRLHHVARKVETLQNFLNLASHNINVGSLVLPLQKAKQNFLCFPMINIDATACFGKS